MNRVIIKGKLLWGKSRVLKNKFQSLFFSEHPGITESEFYKRVTSVLDCGNEKL